MSITRRNKKKWLKENPEWEEFNPAGTIKLGMLVQAWIPKEENPRLGYVMKRGDGSWGVKLFNESPKILDVWFFTLKEK